MLVDSPFYDSTVISSAVCYRRFCCCFYYCCSVVICVAAVVIGTDVEATKKLDFFFVLLK